MRTVRPKDLIGFVGKTAPVDGRAVRKRYAWRPVPPSWRTCRLRMPRGYFFGLVGAWLGALAILLAVALTVRSS